MVTSMMEHITQGTKQLMALASGTPSPAKRDLMQWDRRETSPSAGEPQRKIQMQLRNCFQARQAQGLFMNMGSAAAGRNSTSWIRYIPIRVET